MKNINKRNLTVRLLSILFWILIWQCLSFSLKSELLISSPLAVVNDFFRIITEKELLKTIGFSFIRIVSGFLLGLTFGVVLASASSCSKIIKELLYIPMSFIKSTPVASFIILALIWLNSQNLSVFIAFLMVLPVIYENTLKGILNRDTKLLEMAQVFKMSPISKLKYIYVPSVVPFLTSAIASSLGMSWKAGIAAEVIGIPSGSIGEKLYQAKLYLNTGEVFAWTIIIIILSMMFEKVFLMGVRKFEERLLGGR